MAFEKQKIQAKLHLHLKATYKCVDDDTEFNVPFHRISFVSQQCYDDDKRLCIKEPIYIAKNSDARLHKTNNALNTYLINRDQWSNTHTC